MLIDLSNNIGVVGSHQQLHQLEVTMLDKQTNKQVEEKGRQSIRRSGILRDE